MAGSLGRAFVEVHADTKPFRRELKEGVDAGLAEVDAKVEAHGEKTGEKYADGFSRGRKRRWGGVKRDIETDLKDTERVAKDVGEAAGATVAEGFKLAGDAADEMGQAAADATSLASRGLALMVSGLKAVVGSMGNVGEAITGVVADMADLPALLVTVGLLVALAIPLSVAIGGLIGAMIALVAIIGQVAAALALVLLPAILGITAAVGPLAIAFMSLGKVFALMSEDQKSFATNVKKLDPTLRVIATVLRDVYQSLVKIGESFILKPLLDVFESMRKTLGPVLKSGMIEVAKAWGQFFVSVAKVLGTRQSLHDLQVIFAAMSAAIIKMGPVAARFFQALLDFAASPAVTRFLNGLLDIFGHLIDSWSKWMERVSKDGSLNKFFDSALVTIQKILKLGGALFDLVGSLVTPQTTSNSQTLLDNITIMVETLAKFFRSPEGQQWIEKMFHSLQKILIFGAGLISAFSGILSFFIGLADILTNTVEGIADILIGAINLVIIGINGVISAADFFGAGISHLPTLPYFGQKKGGVSGTWEPGIGQGTQPGLGGLRAPGKMFPGPAATAGTNATLTILEHFFADGGMTGNQSMVAGLHPHEVIIPLTKPARAMQLARQSGLMNMIGGRSIVHVIVALDGTPFYAYTAKAIDAVGDALASGPRMAGLSA